MNQYRIVRFDTPERTFYQVQKKGILWGWNTAHETFCEGEFSWNYDINFLSLADAQECVYADLKRNQNNKITKTVVWP